MIDGEDYRNIYKVLCHILKKIVQGLYLGHTRQATIRGYE